MAQWFQDLGGESKVSSLERDRLRKAAYISALAEYHWPKARRGDEYAQVKLIESAALAHRILRDIGLAAPETGAPGRRRARPVGGKRHELSVYKWAYGKCEDSDEARDNGGRRLRTRRTER